MTLASISHKHGFQVVGRVSLEPEKNTRKMLNRKIIESVHEIKETANSLDDDLRQHGQFAKLIVAILTWRKWMHENNQVKTELPDESYVTIMQHVQGFRQRWHALTNDIAIIALQGDDDERKFKLFFDEVKWLDEYVIQLAELVDMTDDHLDKFKEVTGWSGDLESTVLNLHHGLSILTDELNYLDSEI
jgi:hypothetical protein